MNLEPLRHHPHVVEAIKALWGHPECDIYLTKIMIQDREGRHGFKPDVFKALNKVLNVHRFLYAKPGESFQHPSW